MPPNIEKYRRHVEHFDLTEDQKTELIHTLWRIMEGFADRAFGLDPVQQVEALVLTKDEISPASMIECSHQSKNAQSLACHFEGNTRIPSKRKK